MIYVLVRSARSKQRASFSRRRLNLHKVPAPKISPAEFQALAHTPMCIALVCSSWPFRMGRSPWKEKWVLTDEQRQALAERGRALARNRLSNSTCTGSSLGPG